jgi:hypothetical protein
MARIRSIKPEFWADEELAIQLSRDERMLYLGLWNLADEHARLRGDPRYVKGQLFAYDDDLTAPDIDKMLTRLAELGKVIRYRSGAGRYVFLPKLSSHQRLDADKVPSKLPDPSECDPDGDESARGWPWAPPGFIRAESGRDADESGPGADTSVPDPDSSVLLYGTGSMEHGTGSMEHGDAPASGALFAGGEGAPQPKRARSVPDVSGFDAWYSAFPLHKARGAAETAYAKAVREGASPQVLLDAAVRYRDDEQVKRGFAKHPATWLNQKCWLDEHSPPVAPDRPRAGYQPYRDPDDDSVYEEPF